jgi:hypothetical protein
MRLSCGKREFLAVVWGYLCIWLYRMIQNIYIDGLRRHKLRNTGEEILSCIPDARSQAGFIRAAGEKTPTSMGG